MTAVVGLTAGPAVKAALFDRLAAEADGGLLDGINVDYAWNGDAGLKCIYGGGWRSTQEPAVAEDPGLLVYEVVTVSLYIRVKATPPVPVKQTDAEVARIAGIVGRVLRNKPTLTGGHTWLGIATTQGDYTPDDGDSTSTIAAFAVQIRAMLTWG